MKLSQYMAYECFTLFSIVFASVKQLIDACMASLFKICANSETSIPSTTSHTASTAASQRP